MRMFIRWFDGDSVDCVDRLQSGNSRRPGATEITANKPVVQPVDPTLKLDVPMVPREGSRGPTTRSFWRCAKDVNPAQAGGDEGTRDRYRARQNFDEDVTLKFTGLPKGVTFDPASPVIKRGEKETKLTIKVADDAPPEDFMVKMTGHPTKGADAKNEFKITVAKK